MLAEIITIGDEILIGQIVDTNSAWMAQQLNLSGIRVKQITSVSDEREHILNALKEASTRADVILMTGGLGPTKDDITKKTLAEYFNTGLRVDQDALENVKQIFSRHQSPILDVNLKQAEVLENCTTLLNRNGTAPGMWIEQGGKVFVSMPGVPFEMKYLMEELVIPRITARFSLSHIQHHTIITAGIGESLLAEQIADIEDSLPAHIKLAYLPKLGLVRLRLSGSTVGDPTLLSTEIEGFAKQIVERTSKFVIAERDIAIEKAILDFMTEKNLSLSTAESCTGGYIAHLLTQHPGSSRAFLGGAVTYSNELKTSVLGVNPDTLYQFGAVSQETVEEMSAGAIQAFNSDYALAVSGIAGPDGGTDEKPVGTVWVALSSRTKTISRKFQFGNKRAQNIERAAINALSMLFRFLKENGQ